MTIRFVALVALCVLLLTADAHANSFIFDRSQVVVEMPKTWRVEDSGENVTFSTKDKLVAISLAWAGPKLDRSWDILVGEVNKVVTGVKVTRKPGKTGAFTGYVGTGNGKLGKIDVHCYLAAVMTGGGAMTIFMLYPIGKDTPHKAAIKQFLDSLAPAKTR